VFRNSRPVLAVATVAHLYGADGLLQHPAIHVLHAPSSSPFNVKAATSKPAGAIEAGHLGRGTEPGYKIDP
jgi:hypothetical protein